MRTYWLSSNKMTIFAKVDKHWIVIDTAPIASWSIGKCFYRLREWMESQGGFRMEWLSDGIS